MGVLLAKKMKYFMVTMEVRNFAKAAEALCITRSPLSKAIFELEDYLGGKLFNRTYNSLEPTELAIEYYQKCKPIYEMLVALENECRSGNTESPLMLLFDISVPELLYQQIVMAMKSENILFNCERYVVNLSDLEGISRKNSIIISLREIASNADCDIDKWQGDEIVICMPNDHNIRKTKTDIFIWKDLTTDYIQRSFSQLTKPFIPDINFIEHNLNLTGLLYNVRAGKGCSLLTRKMATMFKVDGITYLPIKDRRPTIHLYHGNQKSVNKFIPQLKNVINTFI
ncbi:LysR family transcriptional regulator [Pseudescherichia vulneris]|uniref:LysR family transcriptional regulator n=1 Tax=Pseudescherichia vulneris TaxID=566 RepID=UPI0028B07257|nr:LysR family transcriptional regulator [Pseudescherichia vulneris]